MRWQSSLSALVSGAILIVSGGCSDSTSPPPDKDPRAYVWKIDTIYNPRTLQTLLLDVWGASPTNVYAVGHSSNYEGKMYHFDGTGWSKVKLHYVEGGTIDGLAELACIYGFSGNLIYAGGVRHLSNGTPVGILARFDGSSWSEVHLDSTGSLKSVWGASPDDMWAGGVGTLLRLQGGMWNSVTYPSRGEEVQFLRIAGSSASDVYLIGASNGPSGQYKYDYRVDLYHYDGLSLSIADSFFVGVGQPPAHFGRAIRYLGGTLFSGGDGFFRMQGGQWLRIGDPPTAITRIAGISPTNAIAVGILGMILHYNGSNLYQYPLNPGTFSFTAVWQYEQGAFAVGHDGVKSYVAHGR